MRYSVLSLNLIAQRLKKKRRTCSCHAMAMAIITELVPSQAYSNEKPGVPTETLGVYLHFGTLGIKKPFKCG